jgi:hypothetical protein
MDALTITPNGDGSPTGSGSGQRTIQVTTEINTSKIKSSNIFTDLYDDDNGQRMAQITYCLRFGLMTPTASAMEVNFIEMVIDLKLDLTSEVVTGVNVVKPESYLLTIVYNYV